MKVKSALASTILRCDFGPFQAPYVPQEVGRVTLWLLPRIVVKGLDLRVKVKSALASTFLKGEVDF